MRERPTVEAKSGWLYGLLVLLPLGAVLVAPGLALRGMFYGCGLVNCDVTPHAEAVRSHLLTAAFAIGTAAPLLGIALSYVAASRAFRWLFGIVLALTLIIALLASMNRVWQEHHNPPPQSSHLPPCLSGSGDCPGG